MTMPEQPRHGMPPNGKYVPYHERFTTALPDRTWPDQLILKAPEWCSVDLRDGNQALRIPMTVEQKLTFYECLLQVGFQQIEIGYPSASRPEHEFTRILIEEKRIPEGVKPQVLTATRQDLIEKTFHAIKGGPETIVHVYNSTSKLQRDVVFQMSKDETLQRAVDAARLVRHLSDTTSTPVRFQYSPESFTGTERDFALDVCNAVIEAWEAKPGREIIINLPSTVEMSTPNVFADQIEWMSRHLKRRDSVILSAHPHNDRGTGVAAAELALMAGAQRIEGTVFGNGERAGNLDIVILALNLFTQGVDPGLWLANIPWLREVYERVTSEKVPNRHPYAGDASPTAYSGTHHVAIRRCLAARKAEKAHEWNVAYQPIDFTDIGRNPELIEVNSQSGKNSTAHVLEDKFGVRLPKDLEGDVGAVVQGWCERTGSLAAPEKVWSLFNESFVTPGGPFGFQTFSRSNVESVDHPVRAELGLTVLGRAVQAEGRGNGPLNAAIHALHSIGINANILAYETHALASGADAPAIAFTKLAVNRQTVWGVGIDTDSEVAAVKAIIAAANRASSQASTPPRT